MSVYNDLQQVWLQRFPDSPMPASWEEHVKVYLAKHKQKLMMFKEEIRKEETYVEYLERLLSDIQKQKKKTENLEEKEPEKNEGGDIIIDNISNSPPPTASGLIFDESESFSAHLCVTELSNELSKQTAENDDSDVSAPDPSSFVTVIEVNGQKSSNATQTPPKLPVKPDFFRNNSVQSKSEHRESIGSSSERVFTPDEPYYDTVASDDQEENLLESDISSAENTLSSTASFAVRHDKGAQSPNASNYVNIEYFIKAPNLNYNGHSSSDEDVADSHHRRSNGSYASSSSLESSTPFSKRKFQTEIADSEVENENSMYKCILLSIIESETNYVEWLSVLIKYMKAIQATLSTSQRIVTETDINTIFYKIPELYSIHVTFLDELKNHMEKGDKKIGESFKTLALKLEVYGAFLSNYGRAVDTVQKCCEANVQFNNVTKNITCKHLSKQPVNLEDILHKPVARVQKNALVLHDLLNSISNTHPDHSSLSDTLQLTQTFLDQFNMIQTKSMFPVPDRAQRRLVKNSFIVEFADGHRKLRHLFLFNDVIACAKYKSSGGRTEKYTFELKWFIPVEHILIVDENSVEQHQESYIPNIVSLKSQASNVRDQLLQEEKALGDKKIRSSRGSDKFRKRLVELESQLVLVSPNLPFRTRSCQTSRLYTFFLSSEFERTQWIDAIYTLQKTGRPPAPTSNFTMFELQTWITACREFLKTNMGSYLLRSGQDESLLVGDLHLHILELTGLDYTTDLYVIFEVDFYGHFFQKAKTKTVTGSNVQWGEKFVIDLEGCENLRVLVYRSTQAHRSNDTLVGKHTQKLSRRWLRQQPFEKKFNINGAILRMNLSFIPCEISLKRIPTGKTGALFGEKILNVCKRQKRDIPFIIAACIREVERRGMLEVGLYRVSGSSSDITKLKKSFETNSYEAEQLLKEVDIHSVTGILKLYLRELPEALFTDLLYPSLSEAFSQTNGNLSRRMESLNDCFSKLPAQNKAIITYILQHLIRVHKHENDNKMSLHNLATVFGPTLLRPGTKANQTKTKDALSVGTMDVMAQAGILYCYLEDLNSTSKKC